jgi:RNA polymerase sigma-70 factor, ECF subfamily
LKRDLVDLAMSGDRDAFSTLAGRALPRLVGTAGLILGRSDLAEDAAQECLVRAWRDLPSLRDPDRFDGWLYRVLLRACHDEVRRARRRSTLNAASELPRFTSDETALVADRDAIAIGLRRIDPDHRTVLVLRYYLDLSYEEMAVAIGVPVGTVKSRVSRALPALRAALAAIERPAPREATQP